MLLVSKTVSYFHGRSEQYKGHIYHLFQSVYARLARLLCDLANAHSAHSSTVSPHERHSRSRPLDFLMFLIPFFKDFRLVRAQTMYADFLLPQYGCL